MAARLRVVGQLPPLLHPLLASHMHTPLHGCACAAAMQGPLNQHTMTIIIYLLRRVSDVACQAAPIAAALPKGPSASREATVSGLYGGAGGASAITDEVYSAIGSLRAAYPKP